MDSLDQQCYDINESLDEQRPSLYMDDQNPSESNLLEKSMQKSIDTLNEEIDAMSQSEKTEETLLYRNLDENSSTSDNTSPTKPPSLSSEKHQTRAENFESLATTNPSQTRDYHKTSNPTQAVKTPANVVTRRPKKTSPDIKTTPTTTKLHKTELKIPIVAQNNQNQDKTQRNHWRPTDDGFQLAKPSNKQPLIKQSITDTERSSKPTHGNISIGNGITINDIPLMFHMAEETSPTTVNFNKMEKALAQLTPKIEKTSMKRQNTVGPTNSSLDTETVFHKTNAGTQISKLSFTVFKRSKSETELKQPRKVSIIRINQDKSEPVEIKEETQTEQTDIYKHTTTDEKQNTERIINHNLTPTGNKDFFEASTYIGLRLSSSSSLGSMRYKSALVIKYGHSSLSVPYIALGKTGKQ